MIGPHVIFPYECDGDTLIVSPRSNREGLDETALESELDALHAMLAEGRVQHLVVDLGSDEYYGSVIIGAIAGLAKQAHGKSAMCHAHNDMKFVLHTIRFNLVVPYFDARTEALQAVRA